MIQENMLAHINFLGSELVITCFANVRDDVEAQCSNLRRLAEVGEVGIILYYVGIIMPAVDGALIELADRLDFPLICMPENSPNLRYSEVISEVMDAIFKDQMTDTHFHSEILERISRLPVYLRGVETAMGILSDRVRVSLLLTDAAGNLLNSVYWPRTLEINPDELIAAYNRGGPSGEQRLYPRRCSMNTAAGSRLDLYIVKQDEALGDEAVRQIAEVLKICINFRNEKYGAQVLPELVQAILQDEPFRMRRIAGAFNIDVASIHTMWIISLPAEKALSMKPDRDPRTLLSLIREELSPYCKTIIADIYSQDIVAFTDNPPEALSLAEALGNSMAAFQAVLTICFNLKDTAQVRRVYLQNKQALAAARALYPHKRVFTRQEIGFADECRNIIAGGEAAVQNRVSALDCLDGGEGRQPGELIKTLSVYLLDSDGSLEICAQKMFLHRNTIKYRINQINGRLGFRLGDLPETMELYTAAAVRRILETRGR
jgi:DNA-binding PucR family transcriptional regulator